MLVSDYESSMMNELLKPPKLSEIAFKTFSSPLGDQYNLRMNQQSKDALNNLDGTSLSTLHKFLSQKIENMAMQNSSKKEFSDVLKQTNKTAIPDNYNLANKPFYDAANFEQIKQEAKIHEISDNATAQLGVGDYSINGYTLVVLDGGEISHFENPNTHIKCDMIHLKSQCGSLYVPYNGANELPDFGSPIDMPKNSYNDTIEWFKHLPDKYADKVNNYVDAIKLRNQKFKETNLSKLSKHRSATNVQDSEQDFYVNSLRHSIGIGYWIYRGLDPDVAVLLSSAHEINDNSLDSQQDKHNNRVAAQMAYDMKSQGKSWNEFVIQATYAAYYAASKQDGFI